jgi:titin
MSGQVHAAILQLRWQNTSSDHTSITIERQNGTSYVQIASLAAASQSYSDSGLSDGTTYCYRVRALNTAGASAYSNSACANTPQPTAPPPEPTPTTTPTPTPTLPGGSVATQTWADYRFAVNMRSTDSQALGVIFRYQDQDNYYRPNAGAWRNR